MLGFLSSVSGNTWAAKLADLARFRQDVNEAKEILPTRSGDIEQRYQQEVNAIFPSVSRGVVGDFQSKLQVFNARKKIHANNKSIENRRFSMPAIQAEKDAIMARITDIANGGNPLNPGDKAGELKALYSELLDGSLDRQRAALEAFIGLSDKRLPIDAGELPRDAKHRLEKLRWTDDLEKSARDLDAATNELLSAREMLRSAALQMGQGDPAGALVGRSEIADNYRLLTLDSDGYLTIRDMNDPAITGVKMSDHPLAPPQEV